MGIGMVASRSVKWEPGYHNNIHLCADDPEGDFVFNEL